MKKLNLIIILTILTFSFGCKNTDNAVYNVLDNVKNGAALRTKERINNDFNIFDLQSEWHIIVEEQDEQYGDLLSKVNLYISFIDNTNNGSENVSETLAKTFEASDFSNSPSNLPMAHLTVTFQEALDVLGITDGHYNGGDKFPIRLELVLTDGRKFSTESVSTTIQGEYWSSPFSYESQILCIPENPITGDYVMNMQDAYGDGWNGASVRVTIDGVATDYLIPDGTSGSATITVPDGTSSLTWEFISGDWDSEVTFQIYGPNSGDIIGDFGPSPAVGELSLNLCGE